jgi:hypothetical protein
MPLFHTTQRVEASGTIDEIIAGAPRQMAIAELVDNAAEPGTFIEVPKLVAGDNAPTTEPSYEEFQYFDGTRAQVRNGDTYPTKTWVLHLPDTHPVMALLFKHEDTDGNSDPKRGHFLAYNSFNPDRSGSKGEFKVNSINAAGEGVHAYSVVVAYKSKERVDSTDNPAPADGGAPDVTAQSPDTGAVGAAVTFTGTNLDVVTSIDFGAGTAAAGTFTSQTETEIVVPVPAGATTAIPELNYAGGSVPSGETFTVTA